MEEVDLVDERYTQSVTSPRGSPFPSMKNWVSGSQGSVKLFELHKMLSRFSGEDEMGTV